MVAGGGSSSLGHEGGALMDEMGVLVKGTPESSLAHRTPREKSPLRQQEMALTRRRMCQRLDLRIPSLQNCERQISVVYKPRNLWYSVRAALTA